MNTVFKFPEALANDIPQMANYAAVEIAERFNSCPSHEDIQSIEQILKSFQNMLSSSGQVAANN